MKGDSGEDAECHAAKLLEVILIQYKGQVDQVSDFLVLFMNLLILLVPGIMRSKLLRRKHYTKCVWFVVRLSSCLSSWPWSVWHVKCVRQSWGPCVYRWWWPLSTTTHPSSWTHYRKCIFPTRLNQSWDSFSHSGCMTQTAFLGKSISYYHYPATVSTSNIYFELFIHVIWCICLQSSRS